MLPSVHPFALPCVSSQWILMKFGINMYFLNALHLIIAPQQEAG